MKLKLNESLKSYDAFLNEREAQAEATPTATVAETPDVDTRSAMIADVDHIITSLETLATAVTEMKEDWTKEFAAFPISINESELNEFNVIAWGRGLRLGKKQKKINVMKMKSSDMATAAAQLQGPENRDKKSYLNDKKKQLDDNVKELQAMVNDRAKEIGAEAELVINRLKRKGQIDIIKSQIGNVDPKKAKEMKDRLADLSAKAKEEDEAIADFKAKADAQAQDEKGDDKVQALKDQLADLKADRKEIDKSTTKGKLQDIKAAIEIELLQAKIKAEDGDPNTDASDHDEKAKELKAKAAELEKEIEAEETSTEEPTDETPAEETPSEETPSEETPSEETPAKKVDSEETPAEETPAKKVDSEETPAEETPSEETPSEETPAKKVDSEETPAEETEDDDEEDKGQPKEALVIRANAAGLNELATEIDSKLDWQVAEGTGLRLKYESMIRKAESEKTLNESRYFNNNMKDAFRRLL